ncbi:MAG: acylneuraminate cytidylyltransferase family protein [Thaumarchaeota archaeon]|nr:acylneuraminate cytidylyltransferase family protein [Nitrososphaerota archaeon]MBI3641331.1 acylneuraminate cytidylyltransferase family protein [Nitrososphaerota archaeon]
MILARGGSKGIPNKNIVNFCGKPLLVWSIEQAKKTKGISSVWVSSDSDKILEIARQNGANTILRPESLAGDTSTGESGWLHGLDEIEKKEKIDTVIALQATSPLRESTDMERALNDFGKGQYDSMFSCVELKDFFIWRKIPDGNYASFNYDYLNRKRRQDITEQFVENGSFYIFKPAILRNLQNRLGGKIGISRMEFWKMFEIDSMEDLELCEILMNHYLLTNEK